MRNDNDILEEALFKNLLHTTITTSPHECQQLCCYFYNPENHKPEYALLCTPFRDGFTICGLQEHQITLNGNFLAIEESADMLCVLRHGRLLLRWILNLRTSYINVKTDFYLKEFLD